MENKTNISLTKAQLAQAETDYEELRGRLRNLWRCFKMCRYAPGGATGTTHDDRLTFIEAAKTFFAPYIIDAGSTATQLIFSFGSLNRVALNIDLGTDELYLRLIVLFNDGTFEGTGVAMQIGSDLPIMRAYKYSRIEIFNEKGIIE